MNPIRRAALERAALTQREIARLRQSDVRIGPPARFNPGDITSVCDPTGAYARPLVYREEKQTQEQADAKLLAAYRKRQRKNERRRQLDGDNAINLLLDP